MDLLIDKSLARGAARTTLREARQEFEARIPQLRNLELVSGEHSAQRVSRRLLAILGPRVVLMRTELAKKKSNVTVLGLDVRKIDCRQELWTFCVFAGEGENAFKWLRYRVAQHALERLQQRKAGVAMNVDVFVDEFGVSMPVILKLSATATSGEAPKNVIVPTQHGALLTTLDDECAYLGTTWVATEQLRPEQKTARDEQLQYGRKVLEGLRVPRRKFRFAARNDSVSHFIRPQVIAVLKA